MSKSTPSIRVFVRIVISARRGTVISRGVAALAAIALAGCAAHQVNPRPAPVPGATASLENRERLLTSLETRAIMEYAGAAGHLKTREQVTVLRPANLRIEAMSPLGVAMVVAADRDHIAVYNPSNNTLIRGAASAATLARFTQIQMPPEQAVQLLLGLAPDESLLSDTPAAQWSEGDTQVFSYAPRSSIEYQLGFTRGELALVRARDASGKMLYQVRYEDYRDIGAINFPFQLDAEFFTSNATIKLRYLDPLIDRPIPDSTFVLSPGPGTRLIELGFAAAPAPHETN